PSQNRGEVENMTDYPMHNSPRCAAKSKRSGKRCKNPAVKGWNVCRMHGARGGAPKGSANGNYRHGGFTAEAQEQEALARLINKEARDFLSSLRLETEENTST
ncbi:MAG: hypothetical protein AAGJ35_10525, partial [Myxococcota bacterium]